MIFSTHDPLLCCRFKARRCRHPECHAVPRSGEKARSEYHFAVDGNLPSGGLDCRRVGKSVVSSAITTRQRRTSVRSGSAANALSPIGKLRSEAVNSGSPVGNLPALPLQPLSADLRKSRLRNFFGPGNEVHAGGKLDDNANLNHENPGPEETCDVGAIEKLAYDLWFARGCPVGAPRSTGLKRSGS